MIEEEKNFFAASASLRSFVRIAVVCVALALCAPAAGADEAGTLAGRNLILIQLESFQNFAVGRTLRGAPITPNLDRLIGEGLWCSQCYPQTAMGNTSDAEFLANTSLFPADKGAAFERFTAGRYESLGNILRDKGYKTAVFHGNTAKVWNRPAMYPALGFERFDAKSAYAPGPTIGLGLADVPFYAETVKKIKSIGEPFFADVLSLSSHHPFKISLSDDSFDPAPYAGTVFGDCLRSLHYADMALGQFIEALRASGVLRRSLVVIYGDHGGVPLSERDRLAHFLRTGGEGIPPAGEPTEPPNPAFWRAQLQVPLLFLAEGSALRGWIDAPVGQIDIAPTIASLMGFSVPGAMGTDLTKGAPDMVVFRDGSVVKSDFWVTGPGERKDQAFYIGAHPFAPAAPHFTSEDCAVLFSAPLTRAGEMLRSSDAILETHVPRPQ